jgi:hypothetical protein
LVEALGRGQQWLLDNGEITELETLTLGQERETVTHWHWSSPVPIDLSFLWDNELQAVVSHGYWTRDIDSLRAKLVQYPAGTRFRVFAFFGPDDLLAPVIRAINETARQHGFTVEMAEPE